MVCYVFNAKSFVAAEHQAMSPESFVKMDSVVHEVFWKLSHTLALFFASATYNKKKVLRCCQIKSQTVLVWWKLMLKHWQDLTNVALTYCSEFGKQSDVKLSSWWCHCVSFWILISNCDQMLHDVKNTFVRDELIVSK